MEEKSSASHKRNEQSDQPGTHSWAGRKRARFELTNSSSQRVEKNDLKSKETEPLEDTLNSDSENYDDIDYGEDEDDYEQVQNKHSQESKSLTSMLDFGEDDDDEDNENENDEVKRSGSRDDDIDECRPKLSTKRNQDELESGIGLPEGEGDVGVDTTNGEAKEPMEKCKYWPACNAGDECSYYHPTKPCRAFPNCRFGQKCLYIHPPCKFNPNCARPGCPFAHPVGLTTARRQMPGYSKSLQQPLAPRCKYGFDCMNLMCKFSHQRSEPCRFGANCLLESCTYTHPSGVTRKKPTSAFKWSAQS